jgi:hypothetical protein
MHVGKNLQVQFQGVGTENTKIKLGDRDLTRHLRSVDIHLRAGELPEVIIRPQVPEAALLLEGSSEDGLWPEITLAPDVAWTLRALGWLGPEDLEDLRAKADQMSQELGKAQVTMAKMEEEVDRLRSRNEDLELANKALAEEIPELSLFEPKAPAEETPDSAGG